VLYVFLLDEFALLVLILEAYKSPSDGQDVFSLLFICEFHA